MNGSNWPPNATTDPFSASRLPTATVNCGTGGSATTATNGTYSITGVTPGTYTCTASAAGYRNKAANASVASNTTTTANFALRRL